MVQYFLESINSTLYLNYVCETKPGLKSTEFNLCAFNKIDLSGKIKGNNKDRGL